MLRRPLRSSGSDLVGSCYTHLFHPPTSPLPKPTVFSSKHVTPQAGTGLVHSAPAHGNEDYQAFVQAGILPSGLRCPINDEGQFTSSLVDWSADENTRRLVGKSVLGDGVDVMIELLQKEGSLLAEEWIEHRYPIDWKTKEPIIVR